MQARKGNCTKGHLGLYLWGAQGCGKSTLALQSMYLKNNGKPFRVLYIDCESGSIDSYIPNLEADGINTENLLIYYTQSLTEVLGIIEKVNKNEDFFEIDDEGNETETVVLDAEGKPFRADCVVVDGTSVLYATSQQSLINFSKKRAMNKAKVQEKVGLEKEVMVQGSSLEMKDWGTLGHQSNQLVLTLTASNVSYIITAREKDEKESKIVNGAIQSISTGRKIADGFGKSPSYNAKSEIHLYRDDDEPDVVKAHVIKDRSMTYSAGDVVIDPSLLDFQKMLDSTSKYSENVIRNTIDHAIKTEQKLFEKALGDDDSDNENNEGTEESLDEMRSRLLTTKNNLSPDKKSKLRSELEARGIPITFKNIKDIDTAKEVDDIIKAL